MSRTICMLLAAIVMPSLALPQSNNYTAEEQQNLRVVQGFWNNVFLARNTDRAAEYLAPDYLEHNPAVPGSPNGGIKGLQEFMNRFRGRGPGARGQAPSSDIVFTAVDGDIVTFLRRQMPLDPASNQPYEAFGFEMFRVRNGKIVEHWDAARRIPPGTLPGAAAPSTGTAGRGNR